MKYKNKIVLITGSGSGIGKAAALAFSKEGGTIIVSDINEINGLKTVSEIIKNNGKATFFKTDVSNFDMVKNLMDFIIEKYGRLDVAINNAGVGGDFAKITDITLESWDKTMSVNSSGVFYCIKTQIPLMLKQGKGVILNTSSIAGIRGLPNAIAYSASKHAVIGITKTAAMEYAKNNIRVNAICPVFTVTPMFDPEAMDKLKEGLSERLKANVPMKRFANVMEQVNTMLWLCSDEASFITGQAISVDGGLTA
ncbi:MAG: glucose 1-dehydrogenase [Flavobacteriaceae bacterium]|jgi:NAD(P)-dependent dehydrogenase (short-subunit alcohol dehydrogenase family)|nr:glucose 1-dehydrogenase [Flavobacteriaceae bacterium]MBT3754115.1 glucose 1-dehydrogenase [Flavobacteriaceae bacterium]MBT3794222.1 glucose 1-dehydrogenase [Flavobacteriaceae bacterium]MBT4063040.1 glucose 1-dehydrogenase [Flavobacteriaceae bacterium]MBT4246753.1 glucose 1-dehydrogenase [Flavobacteriaceae bacterium]|tara:strand:- start:75 stop:833 length:759 start_codon:yes stop_codon:yes gene_type:complete